jgi:HAE1 family hydrophobic/amphiphilic exporter-1
MIGILVIPAMFVVFQILEEKVKKPRVEEISEMNSLD